jgi:hypothetical protein
VAAAESILQQPNRVPWLVGGALIVLFLIGGVIAKPEEAPPPPPVPNPPENARALTVPTDRARTIVVWPCGKPIQATPQQVRERIPPAGATVFELPEAGGNRTMLVPHCQSKEAVSAGGQASAALLAAPERRLPEAQGGGLLAGPLVAKSQVILPGGASAAIVVIPPCRTADAAEGRDAILAVGRSAPIALAPGC